MYRFQRAHHHFEISDLPVFHLNNVHTIDMYPLYRALELKHCRVCLNNLPDVSKIGAKNLTRGTQIEKSNVATLLRGVYHGRPEGTVGGEQFTQALAGTTGHNLVPVLQHFVNAVSHKSSVPNLDTLYIMAYRRDH